MKLKWGGLCVYGVTIPANDPDLSETPQKIDATNAGAVGKGTTSKVKLRGLPYGATLMDVVNFFKGFGVVESAVQFGVNSVSSFVAFSRPAIYYEFLTLLVQVNRFFYQGHWNAWYKH